MIVSLLSAIFYLLAAFKDPGYLRSNQGDTLYSLYQRYEPYAICPDCIVWRPARSRHCQCCDRCVEKFDHHCPWLSNCVGARNLGFFYLFLICTEMSLAIAAVAGLLALVEGRKAVLGVEGVTVKIVGGVIGVSAGLLLLPLSFLCCIQSQNFLAGATTNERFGNKKKGESDLNVSTASMYVDRHNLFRNCLSMCCNAPTSDLPRKSPSYVALKEEEMESSQDLDTSDVQITH